MESIWLIVLAAVFLMVGITMLLFACRNARCAWFIKKTPISAIGDLTTGYAAVRGRVSATEKLLEAPITGKSCVFFLFETSEVSVEQHYSSGGVIDRQSVPWGVDDGTGFAELNLENASNQDSDKSQPFLTLQNKSETLDRISFERAIQRYPTDPWLNELKSISTFGGAVKSLWDTEYRYRETIIRSDDTLYVLGPVTVEENNVRFHSGKGPYIVSNRENRNVLFRSVCYGAGWLALGLASITASGCFIMRWIK